MSEKKIILLIPFFILLFSNGYAQTDAKNYATSNKTDNNIQFKNSKDTSKKIVAHPKEKDIQDVFSHIFHTKAPVNDDAQKKDTRKHFSVIPAAGYTLQTGFAALLSGNMAYYTDTLNTTKLSNINSSITYSQYKQVIIPFQANIWTKGNRFNLITDFRYIDYPSSIYGLGRRVNANTGYNINYTGIKFHQTIIKSISDDIYIGLGYYYDHFYSIDTVKGSTTVINHEIIRRLGKTETASGIALRFLHDTRLNQINPKQGSYYNITYRTSSKSLGSDSAWQSLQIDTRTYIPFPKNSGNTLAFWMFDWLTLNGTPPYLLLPSTGWDDQYNTGRGYIQSRFRGRTMLYFETEYRFAISRNGLIGGVAFANMQHYSTDLSTEYGKIFPGYGVGLRLKLNKYSGTNLCIDYGFGQNGSKGFFVNLGEVF